MKEVNKNSLPAMPRKKMKKRLAKKWAKRYLQASVRVRVWEDLVRTDTNGNHEYRCYAIMPACVRREVMALTPGCWERWERCPDLMVVYCHNSTGELVEVHFNIDWPQSDVALMTGLNLTFDESVEVYPW